MAYKEVHRVEISEVIRRWPAGHSHRRIASGTGLSRDTVAKYIAAAKGLGVSHEGPDPATSRSAGWWPSASRALHLALPQLHLDVGDAPDRANTGNKLMTLVASALARNDCIDDTTCYAPAGRLRSRLPGQGASTLETSLPSFRQTGPLSHGRPLLIAGRGGAASVGIIADGDAQTPDASDGFLISISVWPCIPTGSSEGSLPVQGGSNRVCPSVLAPPNSGVESHRPVRVLDDVGSGRSAGQELYPINSDTVTDRAVVQSLQGRRGVVAGIAVGMIAVAVAPAGGVIATSDCGRQTGCHRLCQFKTSSTGPEELFAGMVSTFLSRLRDVTVAHYSPSSTAPDSPDDDLATGRLI